ncbi:MAG: hypothetical protein H6839_13660 [Planctomycetes bacterium]|nr:hypothetical protein [Planctomycetota bacterium]
MRLLLPLLALLCGCVSAQTIDAERSRFLSAPNGRTGTYAPYRLVLTDLQGADSFTVHSDAPGVSLRREVASAGKQELEVVLPIMVGDDVTVRVSDEAGLERASISPRMPLRRIEPDYARPYAAVFSNNPVYARVLVPNSPRTAVCDYFELGEFFNDWRLFDGYDALVIINPDEARLPPGSQRAIAEYCSLGGNALIIGSFRLGEKDVDVPAPADPQVLLIRGVAVQRFGYGPGAIYRVGFDDLQHSQLAADVVVDALRDQFWFGAADAPGGKPQSRIPPQQTPYPPPLPPADAAPTPLFWGLGGGVLLLCLLAPLVGARVTKRTWPAQLVVLAGCLTVGGVAVTQDRPLPTIELTSVLRGGEGAAASQRTFMLAEDSWNADIEINLNDADRRLARRLAGRPGWNAWAIDLPLVALPDTRGDSSELTGAMVGDEIFRDFATRAHRGGTQFSTSDAYLLEWWLEQNAFRGRNASLTPLEWPSAANGFDDARVIQRSAIRVTDKRLPG